MKAIKMRNKKWKLYRRMKKINVHCSFRFIFGRKFHFRRHFRLRTKMKNAFRSASSIHHKKVLNTRLGLGLEINVLVLISVLKKSLDYITVSV